jgi:hypothetical protein
VIEILSAFLAPGPEWRSGASTWRVTSCEPKQESGAERRYKSHRCLTLVDDRRHHSTVWGTDDAGAGAPDRFRQATDPDEDAVGSCARARQIRPISRIING